MYLSDVLDNIGNGPITSEIIVSAAIIIQAIGPVGGELLLPRHRFTR